MKTETGTLTTFSLDDLVKSLLAARADEDALPKVPEKPKKRHAYTIEGWNAYAEEIARIKEIEHNRYVAQLDIQERINLIEKSLYERIPDKHVWFLTESRAYAVAIQHSNWGGGTSAILIKENPNIEELPELSETFYN